MTIFPVDTRPTGLGAPGGTSLISTGGGRKFSDSWTEQQDQKLVEVWGCARHRLMIQPKAAIDGNDSRASWQSTQTSTALVSKLDRETAVKLVLQ